MTKQFVVITTIFEPNECVKKIAQNENIHLVVAGDKKTPQNWQIEDAKAKVTFLCHDELLGYELEKVLPFNHYCRKMLGYVYAAKNSADMIYETDDDNYPKDNWFIPDFSSSELTTPQDKGFLNVYKYFTSDNIWPRGFPLELLTDSKSVINENELKNTDIKIGIYQGLVDNEPDVDAIYRLTDNKRCLFENKPSIVLAKGSLCPFNSQNTFTIKELFPLLYLPCTVTFRFTDILRGLACQPLMWSAGYHLCFTTSTAIQERNVHNYLKDFESEIPCYLYAQKVVEIANDAIDSAQSLKDNLHNVYNKLLNNGIVKDEEMKILEAWLIDICE